MVKTDRRGLILTKPNQTKLNRSSVILRTTYPRSTVTPTLAGPRGRRPPGMWRSPNRPLAVVVATWLKVTHAAWRRAGAVVAPPIYIIQPGSATRATSTSAYSVLRPIIFIPWLRNGHIGLKVSYRNKKRLRKEISYSLRGSEEWHRRFQVSSD